MAANDLTNDKPKKPFGKIRGELTEGREVTYTADLFSLPLGAEPREDARGGRAFACKTHNRLRDLPGNSRLATIPFLEQASLEPRSPAWHSLVLRIAEFVMQTMINQSDAWMPRQRRFNSCSVCAHDLAPWSEPRAVVVPILGSI